ncbi:glycosyltransferase [Pontimonas sp.]|nr:glycosyltransferase [Pontimonas sp.]
MRKFAQKIEEGCGLNPLGNTLVLSKGDYRTYGAALYQKDFLIELAKHQDFRIHGPGSPNYSPDDTLPVIFAKIGFIPDTILSAHMWLSDNPEGPLDPMPKLELQGFQGLKIGVLNKEYSRLAEKLAWFSEQNFSVLFSHQHQVEEFSRHSGVPAHYLPLAANPELFSSSQTEKDIDFGFSGQLRNPMFPESQSDFRFGVMRHIFHCFRDVPVAKKADWRAFSIQWRSWSGDGLSDRLVKLLPHRRRLPLHAYPSVMSRSKSWLNSPSPAGIISTRYFENALSETLIFTEPSDPLRKLFGEDQLIYVTSPQELEEKFLWLMDHDTERLAIVSANRKTALESHLWKNRIEELLSIASALPR